MIKNEINIKQVTGLKVTRPDSLFSGDNTYSTLFLMPAFDVVLRPGWYKHFVNAYIEDKGLKHFFKRPLFILVQYFNLKDVREMWDYFREKKSFVYSYMVAHNEGVMFRMFVFECPDKFKNDYDLFLKAKYSKFSKDYKSKFQQTVQDVNGSHIESPLYGALHKTSTWKKWLENKIGQEIDAEQECFPKLKPEYEVFRNPVVSFPNLKP